MQAVVWSPQLSNIVKSLKSSKTEVVSAQFGHSLSKAEEKAVRNAFDSETDRKIEVKEAWM
ncbi:hypothetical protein [Paenibacillus sp. MBLB4367]|uniref:hypothetical protein n=1 Tax=Paenibacillus sp. MBLB4367 TaxID=3384767 RepID=UPI003907ED18